MTVRLVQPVVEGHGEKAAVPHLLRRLFTRFGLHGCLRALPPERIAHTGSHWITLKDQAERRTSMRKAWERACAKVRPSGLVLVFLDLDDDLPCLAAPKLRDDLASIDPSISFEIIFAVREFETWFLHAAPSLRDHLPGLGSGETVRHQVRDAKGELERLMRRKYSERLDQPAFAMDFSLDQAMSCPSFARLVRKLTTIAAQ